ncbi:NifB/NifX family molybdenum-iron cluster-binding protein [Slackia piriformis]|uniref:NifB/NifX family molybdenum-iron cluster-binding protein n=2 Tax=Slackia piriformis TaxID=626934 RepID=UPI0023F13EDD|nr:NifB/NifX family molybdenum-iron cluster-binding protein [Slackia piriformis]
MKKKAGGEMKLAIPSMGEGGLEAVRSAHFGHSDCFTMVDIEGGEIKDVSVVDNPPHESGGCLRPVGILSDAGADAIVAGGMGMRPMQGFAQAGIAVLFDAETPSVKDVALKAAAGELPVMGAEHACRH